MNRTNNLLTSFSRDDLADVSLGATMKAFCNKVNYAILANDNPIEYPLSSEIQPLKPGDYSSKDGTCTINESYGDMIREKEVPMCDCSDPENYNFLNEGKFKI